MFQHINNVDNAFKHVRLFTIVVIVTYTALLAYVIFSCLQKVDRANERIYIVANGQAISAEASTRKENIPVEARDHVKVFHSFFFTLSPDQRAIDATIAKAMELADGSAKAAFDDLKEKGYYVSVISGNVSQEVICDSVSVSTSQYPYHFRYYGRQRVIRTSAIITRSLVTEGYLRTVDRTDTNPHGFLVEKWATLVNSDLEIEKR
ncbi:conjugative transposon protein TraK [Chitinophaga arvensicola]|uniref:Bacteroides conjugative transposon TraK protein n=1 Tax=Chitinophaga arvensicola TaxID=29529 RepID=A0A1I0PPT9_9BACT|nr:conjugative transposon protein TraK [Chitinophaga arvensicola]SEW15838.1 Bacteroides conjugative transposon TraK protein [Chitinophaga arvensicola]